MNQGLLSSLHSLMPWSLVFNDAEFRSMFDDTGSFVKNRVHPYDDSFVPPNSREHIIKYFSPVSLYMGEKAG